MGLTPHISFHHRKAVAPLKPEHQDQEPGLHPAFPPPKGGGPIEAQRRTRNRPMTGWFPPPKGGGPIEARSPPALSPPTGRFPPPKGGGPIEARSPPALSPPTGRFPPPKGGGPIEGLTFRQPFMSRRRSFHHRKAVASLKQCHATLLGGGVKARVVWYADIEIAESLVEATTAHQPVVPFEPHSCRQAGGPPNMSFQWRGKAQSRARRGRRRGRPGC